MADPRRKRWFRKKEDRIFSQKSQQKMLLCGRKQDGQTVNSELSIWPANLEMILGVYIPSGVFFRCGKISYLSQEMKLDKEKLYYFFLNSVGIYVCVNHIIHTAHIINTGYYLLQ